MLISMYEWIMSYSGFSLSPLIYPSAKPQNMFIFFPE